MSLDLMKGIDIRYSEDQIIELGKKLGWKGRGTENDPIVIGSEEGLPHKFAFMESRLFIKISNCTIGYLAFYKCQNITTDNCSFEVLDIMYCTKIVVSQSNIHKLDLSVSINNRFIDCAISKVFRLGSDQNVYKNCIFTKRAQKNIDKGFFDISDMMKVLRFGVIIGGLMIVLYVSFYIFNEYPIGLNIVLSLLIYIGFIIVYLLLRKLQKIDILNFSKKKKVNNNI